MVRRKKMPKGNNRKKLQQMHSIINTSNSLSMVAVILGQYTANYII